MPTYSYACTECGNRFDVVQAFTDDALTTCEKCSGRLRKLFGNVGVVFKGSGFYRTDSRESAKSSKRLSQDRFVVELRELEHGRHVELLVGEVELVERLIQVRHTSSSSAPSKSAGHHLQLAGYPQAAFAVRALRLLTLTVVAWRIPRHR